MPDPLTSVPLRPGMAQRGVPVAVTDPDGCRRSGVIAYVFDGPWVTITPDGGEQAPACVWIPGWVGASLHLDLTEPLGRAVGWWWIGQQDRYEVVDATERIAMSAEEMGELLHWSRGWHDMTPEQIDRFARLILAVQS